MTAHVPVLQQDPFDPLWLNSLPPDAAKATPQDPSSLAAKLPIIEGQLQTISHESPQRYQGRGKTLSIPHQIVLVELCRLRRIPDHGVATFTKSFWIGISHALEEDTGRTYSWQSCRRRMLALFAQRNEFWATIQEENRYPECGLDSEIADEMDLLLEETGEGPDFPREKKEAARRRHMKAQHAQQIQQARIIPRTPEVPQPTKQLRVSNWVLGLPAQEEMEQLPLHWGEPREHFSRRFFLTTNDLLSSQHTHSQSQSQSRSPYPDGVTQPRSRSPRTTALENLLRPHALPVQHPSVRPERPSVQDESSATFQISGDASRPEQSRKRPREDEPANEPPARRIRQTPRSHPSESPSEQRQAICREQLQIVENSVNSTFGNFWERVAPFFKDRELPSAVKSESIMRDLFKDVGTAIAKALLRMGEEERRD